MAAKELMIEGLLILMRISETKGFDVKETSNKFHEYVSLLINQFQETEKQLQELNKKIVAQQTQASPVSPSTQNPYFQTIKKTSPKSKIPGPLPVSQPVNLQPSEVIPLDVLFKELASLKKQYQQELECLERVFQNIEQKVRELPDLSSHLLAPSFQSILDIKNNFANSLRLSVLNIVIHVLKNRETKARRILPPSYSSLSKPKPVQNSLDELDDSFLWEDSEVLQLIEQGSKLKNHTLDINSFSEFDSNLAEIIQKEFFEVTKSLITGRFQKSISIPIDELVFQSSIQCMAYMASILTYQNKEKWETFISMYGPNSHWIMMATNKEQRHVPLRFFDSLISIRPNLIEVNKKKKQN